MTRDAAMVPVASAGIIAGRAHRFARQVCLARQVFFEDMGLAGLVYHADYLRFMERAR